MGNSTSKEYLLPSGLNYIVSYCKIHTLPVHTCYGSSDLTYFTECDKLLLIPFYYKLRNMGYAVKSSHFKAYYLNIKLPLNELIQKIIKAGIPNSSGELLDVDIKHTCYYPTLNNIHVLLDSGNILIAGLIIDKEFIKKVLNSDDVINEIVSDIVLIIGYTKENILIKTNWTSSIIHVPISFISNFREIWNIEIESPEDNFLNKELKNFLF